MRFARSLLKLTRLDSSLLIALAVFLPSLTKTRSISLSLGRAIPLLFIGMCTFIANDLDDLEKDRTNHPDRPLPSGFIRPSFAATLYFLFLVAAFFATRLYVPERIAFWYYLLLALTISYGYVVDCFPGLKAPYVACATTAPILLAAEYHPGWPRLYFVAASVFFIALGRELCMDVADRPGDPISFMHNIGAKSMAIIAFTLQAMGLLLLATQVACLLDLLDIILLASLLVLSACYWFESALYRKAIFIMKLQFLAGLYFLANAL